MAECIRGEGLNCEGFETKVRSVLALKTIAVVGMSPQEDRPSYRVGKYLIEHGYDVIPVRPGGGEILGRPVFASLMDIPHPVDIVDVFRKSEDCEAIARDAVKIGARVLWLQEDVISPAAELIATEAGLLFQMDTCIKKMHVKYIGD
jgi:predicted CoA-binding protein